MRGNKKLKYYNPFNVCVGDKVQFCFFDNKMLKGKVLSIEYPQLLVNANYNIYLIYIGQIKRKLITLFQQHCHIILFYDKLHNELELPPYICGIKDFILTTQLFNFYLLTQKVTRLGKTHTQSFLLIFEFEFSKKIIGNAWGLGRIYDTPFLLDTLHHHTQKRNKNPFLLFPILCSCRNVCIKRTRKSRLSPSF